MSTSSILNSIIHLIPLQRRLGLSSDSFFVEDIKEEGGMSLCYVLSHVETNDRFALKVIRRKLLLDTRSRLRYIDEIKKWTTYSSHEGVLEAICVCDYNEIPCVASNWMENGTIRGHLNKENELYVYQSLERIIKTLNWVFRNYKTIHRDLKPENILIDNLFRTQIADWGISKEIFENPFTDKKFNEILDEDESYFIGSVSYASPEQINSSSNLDFRSDIYSLGCILFELETGSIPHYNYSLSKLKYNRMSNEYNISDYLESNTLGLNQIILKCLEFNPENRFESYESLLESLYVNANKKFNNYKYIQIGKRYEMPNVGKRDQNKNSDEGVIYKSSEFELTEIDIVEKYFKEAVILCNIGQFKEAKEIFERYYIEKLFMDNPDYPTNQFIAVNYGNCLSNLGNFTEALKVFNSIQHATSKAIEWYINLSLLYLRMNNWESAEKIAKEGLGLDFSDYTLLENLSSSLLSQKKFEEAYELLKNLYELNQDIHSIFAMGNYYFLYADHIKNIDLPNAVRNYKKSINYFEQALNLNPLYSNPIVNKMHCLIKITRYQSALELANSILESDQYGYQTKSTAIVIIAKVFLWNVGYEECINFCEKWISNFSGSIQTHLKRIRAEAILDSFYEQNCKHSLEEEINFFEQLLHEQSQIIENDYYVYSKLLFVSNTIDPNKILEILSKAIKKYPEYWKFYYQVGVIYSKYELFEPALEYLNVASQLAPWRECVWFSLSNIYKMRNENEKSKDLYEHALHIKSEKKRIYSES